MPSVTARAGERKWKKIRKANGVSGRFDQSDLLHTHTLKTKTLFAITGVSNYLCTADHHQIMLHCSTPAFEAGRGGIVTKNHLI